MVKNKSNGRLMKGTVIDFNSWVIRFISCAGEALELPRKDWEIVFKPM